jgi:hypothetical protein
MLRKAISTFLMLSIMALTLILVELRMPLAGFAQGTGPVMEPFVSWTSVGFYLDELAISAEYAATRPFLQTSSNGSAPAGIDQDVQYLRERWLAGQKQQKQVPAIYANSLQLDSILLNAWALKEFAGRTLTDRESALLLQDVADDLETKAAQCKLSRAGWASLVDVTVNTRRGAQLLSGYEVWYVPKGWASVRSMWQRFPQLSSPTGLSLAPGNYLVAVNKGRPEQIRVGGTGQQHEQIDLLVP